MSNTKLCKVCSKEVAKSAKICPHCGARLKMGIVKKSVIVMGVILALICIAAATDGNDSTSPSNSNTAQTTGNKKSNSEWNTSDTNIENNGNMTTAVNLIKSDSNLKSKAIVSDTASVAKSPFKYYGKVIQVAGTISDIEEYASDTDWSKELGGGEAGQIVIVSDDGTVIDMFVVGNTGDLKKGDYVTLYGYPIGITSNDNLSGGKTDELAIVGNSFNKADDSVN